MSQALNVTVTDDAVRISTVSTGEADKKFLTGYGPFEELPSIRPLLFGQLVERAVPIVKEYHSDLYHDAQWIEKHVTGELTFLFVAREWGTYIGFPEFYATLVEARVFRDTDKAWLVSLVDEDGRWSAVFREIVR